MTLNSYGECKARQIFVQYKKSRVYSEFSPSNSMPRILVTGFRSFNGLKLNPSGRIVEHIATGTTANEHLWLEQSGGQAIDREIFFDGQRALFRFVVMDVLWGVSGAIVSLEIERFRPNVVLMLGAGPSGILEAGATNASQKLNGFDSFGVKEVTNLPIDKKGLSCWAENSVQKINWEASRFRNDLSKTHPQVSSQIKIATHARETNQYICNHVSLAAIATLQGLRFELAGHLPQTSDFHKTKVGFFHVPSNLNLDSTTLSQWSEFTRELAFLNLN